jgi:hypothetical protein
MCDFSGWGRRGDGKDDAHTQFKTAMVLKFIEPYGTEDIECWHEFCIAVGICPLPRIITSYKTVGIALYRFQLVKRTHRITGNTEGLCELD